MVRPGCLQQHRPFGDLPRSLGTGESLLKTLFEGNDSGLVIGAGVVRVKATLLTTITLGEGDYSYAIVAYT